MHGGDDRRGMRKPLIVMTPKSLLRHVRAISRLTDGRRYKGRILRTILRGETVWDGTAITAPPGIGRFVKPEDPR
jgi:hypothetical protein